MLKDSLSEHIYRKLSEGIQTSRHPYNFASLATNIQRSSYQRMVVIRGIKENIIRFYTDSRSSKVVQLRTNPKASLLFYDYKEMEQISLTGTVSISEDFNDATWKDIPRRSYRDYTATMVPGSLVASPTSIVYNSQEPYFCCLEFQFQSIDYLSINRECNTRIKAQYQNNQWKASYVVP